MNWLYFVSALVLLFGSILFFKLKRQKFIIAQYWQITSKEKLFHISTTITKISRVKHGWWILWHYYFSWSRRNGHHYDISFKVTVRAKDGADYYLETWYNNSFLPDNIKDIISILEYENKLLFVWKKVETYFNENSIPFIENPFDMNSFT